MMGAQGQGVELQNNGEAIEGPPDGADRGAWLADMKRWRDQERATIEYDGAEYARKELLWTQRSFVQPQMMVEERYFYDAAAGKYTVDRYVDDLEKRYGGIDAVLIWPVYPNIGIDNRSQHDLLHDMPGWPAGVKGMVDDFHRRGVKVFFPVMPWDTGTHRPEIPWWDQAARDMKEIGADGLNGDTMHGVRIEFRQASDRTGHIVALEPEVAMSESKMVIWNTMSWGYWKYDQPIPVVSAYKWIEPRHMANVCERWVRDRTNGLQSAWFNGTGYESWENVWGIWNQFTPRDAEALRRIATIERAVADLLVSADWEPHAPTLAKGVYASRFPGRGQTVWTLVNRTDQDTAGEQLRLPHKAGTRYYDLWAGAELKPAVVGDAATLAFEIEAHGFGGVLAVEDGHTPEYLPKLLARMAELSQTRLSSLSAEWKALPQTMVDIAPTKPATEAPEDMVLIPAAKYRFKVSGVEIEGKDEPGVDVQYPWEDLPRRHHDKEMDVKAFYIDRYPVTNEQYKKFVDASGYRPKDDHNFLKGWKGGTCPEGWANKPVTWVSIEDARAYAAWAGKRLPHEWEWQYAAQGTDGREYPWGAEPIADATPPFVEDSPDLRGPTDVDAHPKGASPFGVIDMTGNVWQWTSEFLDEHTRAAIVRGGSYYRPKASHWYFPRNTKLSEHGKYLLMAPSKDRSGTVGFRCVVDAG
ncbi:MAG: SUMF1/EgtB/PvdO family nonheme iron enzyme [Planctomycetes bacterium]|nr:SUMF1/EgtB/PvdO family nonheme iron enzyme [Planctomycetota bacterium]